MANKKTNSKPKTNTGAKSKVEPLKVIEEAMKNVVDVKSKAQAEYDAAVASLVIVRN